jgi:hypothetical protein
MKERPNDNRRWVIVFNMQSLISPIRHIIELHDVEYNEAEFAEWYYERYNKLEGDQFICFESTKNMRVGEAEIIQRYDEAAAKEERRENWKEYCAKNSGKRSASE